MTDTQMTVQSGRLRHMLRAALVASAENDDHPGLAGVLLHSATKQDGSQVLVATATDRYMLAQIHVQGDGTLPHPVFLYAEDVRVVAAALVSMVDVATLSVDNESLTVKLDGGHTRATVKVSKSIFPKKIGSLMGPFEPSAETSMFAPWIVRRIAKIAEKLDRDDVRFSLSGVKKAAVVYIGNECRVLAMPQFPREGLSTPPIFDPFPDVDPGEDGGPDAA